MSSYRKYRSKKSIYHPGISLDHPVTYNQKKGMIITRSTDLPEVPEIYSKKKLDAMLKVLLRYNWLPYPAMYIKLVQYPINGLGTNELILNSKNTYEQNILPQGTPYVITDFAIVEGTGSTPTIDYQLFLGETRILNVSPQQVQSVEALDGSVVVPCPRVAKTAGRLEYPYIQYETTDHMAVLFNDRSYPEAQFGRIFPWNDSGDATHTKLTIGSASNTANWALMITYTFISWL